jgi:hypothetical protein
MRRPDLNPSRASDVLIVAVSLIAAAALLPWEGVATVALGILAATLIVWPVGVLLWLAQRWARIGDLRFVMLAIVLATLATASALLAIRITG